MKEFTNLTAFASKLKNLIEEGRISAAFKELSDFFKSGMYDISETEPMYIMLSGQYKKLQQDNAWGLILGERYSIETNRIMGALIHLIQEIKYLVPRTNSKNLPVLYSLSGDMLEVNSNIIDEIKLMFDIKKQIMAFAEDINLEISTKRKEIEKLKKRKNEIEKQIFEKEKAYQKLKKEYDAIQREKIQKGTLYEQLENMEKELEKSNAEKLITEDKFNKEREKSEAYASDLIMLRIECEKLYNRKDEISKTTTTQLEQLNTNLNKERSSLKNNELEKNNLKKEISDLKKELTKFKNVVMTLEEINDKLNKQIQDKNSALSILEGNNTFYKEKLTILHKNNQFLIFGLLTTIICALLIFFIIIN